LAKIPELQARVGPAEYHSRLFGNRANDFAGKAMSIEILFHFM
jgi:hypothetical protein